MHTGTFPETSHIGRDIRCVSGLEAAVGALSRACACQSVSLLQPQARGGGGGGGGGFIDKQREEKQEEETVIQGQRIVVKTSTLVVKTSTLVVKASTLVVKRRKQLFKANV